jgi:hypothetical protein
MIFYTIFLNKTSDEIWNKKNQTICNLKWFMQCAHGRLEMKMQRGIRAGERDHVGGQQGRDPAGRDSAKLTSSVARSENASGQLAVLVGKGRPDAGRHGDGVGARARYDALLAEWQQAACLERPPLAASIISNPRRPKE